MIQLQQKEEEENLKLGYILNEIRVEIYKAVQKNTSPSDLALLQKKYTRWLLRWTKTRYNSTLFL